MRICKILKVLTLVIVSLVLIVTVAVNSSFVQKKIIDVATEAISEELDTEVKIKGVNLNLVGQRVTIHGVRLLDQHKRELLHVKEIWANFCLLPLLKGKIALKEFKINGVDMLLINPEDGPANYQFLIDATKKDGKKKKKDKPSTFLADMLQHAMLNKLHVRYNNQDYLLEKAVYSFWRDQRHVDIKGLHFKTDNHLPRKNTNKPHRGFFDAGHLDCIADLSLDINHIGKDTLRGTITKCSVTDTITGIYLNNISSGIIYTNKQIHLSDIVVNQVSTRFDIPEADIVLPDKEKGTYLHYKADSIRARVMLKDIAQPFAPVLKRFSIPLNLRVRLEGTANGMTFRDIYVNSDDEKLKIHSTGIMRNMKKARDLTLHFEVHDMVVKPGIKDKLINQFSVKKHMMYQVYALGVVKYHGSFDILWKKQQFRGLMNTEMGDLDFEFQLDGNTKYLTGWASSDSLKLGELFKLKRIKDIDASATFSIDISRQRTAELRKERGGKLPIGNVEADVRKIGYRNIYLKNIFANIESDGAEAKGLVTLKGHLTDLMLEFSFADTEQMHKMKVKPRLMFRSIVKDDE